MGKKKLSKLSDNDEALLAGKSKKERAEAVDGRPDSTDERLLGMLFGIYEKETHGKLSRLFNDLRLQRALIKNLKPVDKAERLTFTMPVDLEAEVRHWWPSIWTNLEHTRWFLKKFPQFRKG